MHSFYGQHNVPIIMMLLDLMNDQPIYKYVRNPLYLSSKLSALCHPRRTSYFCIACTYIPT